MQACLQKFLFIYLFYFILFFVVVVVFFLLLFFFCLGFTQKNYFTYFEPSQSWGGEKTEDPHEKPPDHPQAELWLSHMWPELGLNPQRWELFLFMIMNSIWAETRENVTRTNVWYPEILSFLESAIFPKLNTLCLVRIVQIISDVCQIYCMYPNVFINGQKWHKTAYKFYICLFLSMKKYWL